MIKNPWPMKWTCPMPEFEHERFTCHFSERYDLPCGTKRRECETCYMRQQYLGDQYNRRQKKKKNRIVHVCDRCGAELGSIDLAVYIDISNRDGRSLVTQELCFICASDIIEWTQEIKKAQEEDPAP